MQVESFPDKRWGYVYQEILESPGRAPKETVIYRFDSIWYHVARVSPHVLYVRLTGKDKQVSAKLVEALLTSQTTGEHITKVCKDLGLFQGKQLINLDDLKARLKNAIRRN